MGSLVLSTVAFFIASFLVGRYLNRIDAPRGMTRSILKFCAALLVAYGVMLVVDRIAS